MPVPAPKDPKDLKDHIPKSWSAPLQQALAGDDLARAAAFLRGQQSAGKVIYPPIEELLNAFNLTDFNDVKVVILGQDPYHGPKQAHGLAFSVPHGVRVPPSLKNIYKELERDFGHTPPSHGTLTSWASQGVFLLNSVLTVEAHKAASHQKQGWEGFTDDVIRALNQEKDGLVFMLWGAYAQKKASFVDQNRHLVLQAVHPSPLSAHRGFIGCGHFRSANRFLQDQGKSPIDWQIKEADKSQLSFL